jgi:hypothetical protein
MEPPVNIFYYDRSVNKFYDRFADVDNSSIVCNQVYRITSEIHTAFHVQVLMEPFIAVRDLAGIVDTSNMPYEQAVLEHLQGLGNITFTLIDVDKNS